MGSDSGFPAAAQDSELPPGRTVMSPGLGDSRPEQAAILKGGAEAASGGSD